MSPMRLALVPMLLAAAVESPASPVFGDGFEPFCGEVLSAESFGADSPAWPEPWQVSGGVDDAPVVAGEGWLRPAPSAYSLARMAAPLAARDVQVRFAMRLQDAATQGVGFYVRSNGGYLQQTDPAGAGYAVFVEGTFRGLPGVGLWKEENGQEIQLAHSGGAAPSPQAGVTYQVRLRVHQFDAAQTFMQARIWADGDAEPVTWQVEVLDATPSLQSITGGIAVDSWSVLQPPGPITGYTVVDDIVVTALCNPPAGASAAALPATGSRFTPARGGR